MADFSSKFTIGNTLKIYKHFDKYWYWQSVFLALEYLYQCPNQNDLLANNHWPSPEITNGCTILLSLLDQRGSYTSLAGPDMISNLNTYIIRAYYYEYRWKLSICGSFSSSFFIYVFMATRSWRSHRQAESDCICCDMRIKENNSSKITSMHTTSINLVSSLYVGCKLSSLKLWLETP